MQGEKSLAVGETVWAMWPGSRKYYEATILNVGKTKVEVNFKENYKTEVALKNVYRQLPFRSRSTSPARSPARRRSRSPGRRSRSRSRSPARSRGRPPAQKTSEESLVAKVKQEIATPSRRSSRRSRMPEKTVEESSTLTTTVTKDSATVTTTRVTRSVTKKLIAEEKEAFHTPEVKPNPMNSSHGYEFGGPVGVCLMMIGLPAMVIASYLFCNKDGCSIHQRPSIPQVWSFSGGFFDIGHLIVLGWIIFQAIIYMLPIGKVIKGRVLADGTCLDYRTNGFIALILSAVGFAVCLYLKVQVSMVYDTFIGIITATILWSIIIAVIVYIMACQQKRGLAPGGNTGNVIYDFFMGHQLNPRLGKFDFKFFFEVRPGLIGWVMINFCMAAKEFNKRGEVSPAMMLVCIFQLIYVADCLFYESSILSTMDIIDEGFGFMLAFGDISWVPIMYSIQARYLVDNPVMITNLTIAAIVTLFVIGYGIFRGANSQKDRFRTDPDSEEFRDEETILTPTGKRLLVSGWWGLVRHPNYLGDIIMAIAWSIPCGFSNPFPFFYPVYLTILLVHREFRDEANSRRKYGASWDEYCRRVPYRILPKIF